MRSFRLSPLAFRRITLGALVALAVIIVTGGAVRLTDSGLGCPEWPNCETGSLVPRGATGAHGTIEWANRLFTGAVSVAVVLAVLGSLVRVPRRPDLTRLALGLVAGVIGQIVLGGFTVMFDLAPPFVMAHFLLSLVLVADALVLHHRAGQPDGVPLVPIVPTEVRSAAKWLVGAAGVVVATGTVVTGTGPHGGDATAPRLRFDVADVARLHGIAVNLLVAGTLLLLWLIHRSGAPAAAVRRARALLAVEVAQAVVGYTQYFNGVPEGLVAVHLVGSVGVWIAAIRVLLGLRVPRPPTSPVAPIVARGLRPQLETMFTIMGPSAPTLDPTEIREPVHDEDVRPDRPWVVIVWNDPINLMSYVTLVFQKLFGYSREKAEKLMLDVHQKGRAVVSSGSREKSELDVFRLHEHGLWATMQHDE